jgi:DNA-binding protein YbaB
MNELMRQAARMQRKIEEKKTEVPDIEVIGDRRRRQGQGDVDVRSQGLAHRDRSRVPEGEGIDLALDGACAAVNAALEAADKAMEAEIAKVTGGMKIPGSV